MDTSKVKDSASGGASLKEKSHQGRGPGYPFIPIEKAIARAFEMKQREGFYPVPREAAYKAWDFGAKSSGARQTIAALKHYGLLEYVGSGDAAKVKLTDLARRIILDVRPDSEERAALIQQAAFMPAIHADLARRYPDGLPSDTTIQVYLTLEKGFTEPGAKDLIAQYRSTLAFIKGSKPDTLPPASVVEAADDSDDVPQIEVGDLVKVEIGGVLQFSEAKRVRAIQEHQGNFWVFIDGSDTGIPMEQATLETKALPGAVAPPKLQIDVGAIKTITPLKSGMKEEKNSLDEGEAVLIWPETLSSESVRDLEYWLQGVINKAKRRAGTT